MYNIPSDTKIKTYIKRIVFGKLFPLPPEVHEAMAEAAPLIPIAPVFPINQFKILYAAGRKKEAVP